VAKKSKKVRHLIHTGDMIFDAVSDTGSSPVVKLYDSDLDGSKRKLIASLEDNDNNGYNIKLGKRELFVNYGEGHDLLMLLIENLYARDECLSPTYRRIKVGLKDKVNKVDIWND